MPTYVYKCVHCGHVDEVTYPITYDKPEWRWCPNRCNRNSMKRIIAPTSFILKGPGWAKDGYSK
jgi:putative FmdB family regulatory protein